ADALENKASQIERGAEFSFDLFGRAENVRVVLSQTAHAQHAIQLAGLFVSIDGAEFKQPYRQVTIAARCGLVDFDVVRAVHRLQQITLLLTLPPLQGGNLVFARPVDFVIRYLATEDRSGLDKLLL